MEQKKPIKISKKKLTQASNSKTNTSYAEFALTSLVSLQKRFRWASLDELRFIAVNEIKELIPFQQALLWEKTEILNKNKITAVSGIVEPDKNSPYIQFMTSLMKYLIKNPLKDDMGFEVKKSDIEDKDLKQEWAEFLPKYLWIQPLTAGLNQDKDCLILARAQSWQDGEIRLISEIADTIAASMLHNKRNIIKEKPLNKVVNKVKEKPIIMAIIALILLFPMRLSVLSPAEIIAKNPKLIRAPIEGVIADIPVKPNQKVKIGDILVKFDAAEIEARIKLAESSLKVTTTELRQVAQEAFTDNNAKLRLVSLQGQVEKDKTDIAYLSELLSRGIIKAEQDGVIVFEDAYDWLGRPVSIGEKIMLLADPKKTELEIQLDANQVMDFPDKASISFFSNISPDQPNDAVLSFFSYRAVKGDNNLMTYRLKGELEDGNQLRLGLKGTAKIYGKRRPFIWHMIRKPLSILRQWLGI